MKTSKKVISLVLTAIMVLTTFVVAVPMLLVDADAATTIDGVSQTQIVTDTTVYDTYAANYLNGAGYSTGIIIPGLNATYTDGTTDQDDPGDYVVQGMTYYPDRDWMLVTAYHSDGNASSKVFALDAATGEFVAMFSFLNPDGTENTDHGGGIAVSENNLYYSCGDKERYIAYAPLSALANAPLNAHTTIQLVDKLEFVEVGSISYDSKTAYSAYVCYDQGILWMGNFYDLGAKLLGVTIAAADYNAPSNNTYNSMVFGYKLAGNSSAEEWAHLKGTFKNLMNVTTASGTGSSNDSTHTWNAYQNGTNINIAGTITAPTAYVGEFTGSYGSFTLTEGVNYTIEFKSTNKNTDMYMFSPAGTHCNVKQSSQTTITQLEDGRYHYVMKFTAGLKPTGADSSWPTTQSTDGTYTGTYTVRFDQDAIQAGETREYAITDVKVSQTNTYENAESVVDEGYAGSPSYAIGLNNTLKDVQYATVDNGKLYLSRSYGSGAGNSVSFGFGETSFLTVADIDLSVPGTVPVTISTTGTDSLDKTVMAYDISEYDDFPMMPMSEGLCVIDDNIFITFEGASNKYLNESSGLTSIGNCEKPVDVIWQLDPYALMDQAVAEPEKSIYYEKVSSLAEIESGAEYIIVHQSPEKDPVTQEQILYALNTDGNFKDYKLTKSSASTVNGYNGMIGHAISDYDLVDDDGDGSSERLYLNDPDNDDIESVRWTLTNISGNAYRFTSTDPYFANCNNLYFDEDQISMAPGNASYLSNMKILESGNGKGGFWLSNAETYFLWSNDGLSEDYKKKINSYYISNSGTTAMYSGIYEQPGTFHCDALNLSGANIIGASVPTDNSYGDGVFYLFKRVVDEVASTYESRVYTNLNAELQEDGTYTVDLETYAISPNHYQHRGVMPTDYIIVADTSSSMANTGSTGIASYNSSLAVSSLSLEANTSDDNGVGVSGYAFSNPDEDIYYMHTDGKYYKVYLAVNTVEYKKVLGITSSFKQRYWAYYIADDGLYYVLQTSGICGGTDGGVHAGITETEFKNRVDNSSDLGDSSYYSAYSTKTSNSNRRSTTVFTGPHYRFDDISSAYTTEHTRISTLKNAVSNLVGQIAAENSENRIALVQFGGSTGFYNTSSTLSTTDYANAFWSASNASGLQTIASNLTTSDLTTNDGIEFTYVNNIMSNSGIDYTGEDSTRNVAVIYLSDGVAGADDQSDPTTAANNVIAKALTAKHAGAFVYTVMIGADGTSFNRNLFMEAVSSKYAEAASMTDLGGQSVDGVTYALSLATTTINNFINFGEVTLKETSTNNAVGLENLDANSYLREKLSEAFKFPEDSSHYNVKVELVPGVFDKIGRFSFDEASATENHSVTHEVDTANRTITVTNYNYSEQYIGKDRTTPGNKLRVTITGLLANEAAKIQNTSINDTTTTGIFKTEAKMNANEAFKYLPTEYFNIPEYTYVLDYGLPMYDSDVNGTLKSVSADLSRQRDADGNLAYKSESENGLVAITNNNLDLLYTTTPTNFADSGYCLIQRDDGTYDWFEIKVVPASNVLFEENYVNDGKAGSVSWATEGTALNNYQSLTNDETDTYGYDAAYATTTHAHSNGTATKATVTSSAKRSTTKTFDFVGEGFDLISACGANTGIMVVKVSGGNLARAKSYIVDTYYSGEYATGTNNLLCQTPIVSFTGDHGTYTVEATATYLSTASALQKSVTGKTSNGKLSGTTAVPATAADTNALLAELGMSDLANTDVELVWFDDNSVLNGGTGAKGNTKTARDGTTTTSLDCYIDGFRIYHPMSDEEVEYIEKEQSATYLNVIDNINSGMISTEGTTSVDSLAYVVGSLTEGTALSFANYETVGPQNEFYLTDNNTTGALVLKVSLPTPTARVHLGLRAVTGAATVKVGETTFTINGPTEMYYDVTDCVTVDDTGVATITIQNTGSGVLAINNIKLTGEAAVATFTSDDMASAYTLMTAEPVRADVVNGVVTPVVEDTDTDTDVDNGTDTDTETDNDTGSSNLSFIEQIIAMIMEILSSIFQFLPVGGVA